MSIDTTAARDHSRATQSLIKGVGASLAGKKRGPDRRVRRNSVDVNDARAQVWRPINGGKKRDGLAWRDTLLKVAREYDLAGKQHGRWAPLGPFTRDVLAALLDLVDFKTGRLEPTYAKLMAMTKLAKSTISSALRKLRAHGFLDWVRRSRVVDTGDGQARQQTSNAFIFELSRMPKNAWRRFRDLMARRERAAAASDAATSQAPPAPPTRPLMPTDPELRAAIEALQARIDEGAE